MRKRGDSRQLRQARFKIGNAERQMIWMLKNSWRYAAGERDFHAADLSGAHLHEVDLNSLEEVILCEADLSGEPSRGRLMG